MFWMSTFLHLFSMVSIVMLGITKAIVPCAIVTVLHCAYLFFVYKKINKAKA